MHLLPVWQDNAIESQGVQLLMHYSLVIWHAATAPEWKRIEKQGNKYKVNISVVNVKNKTSSNARKSIKCIDLVPYEWFSSPQEINQNKFLKWIKRLL